MSERGLGRHAGVVIPTFSLRSATDWGIGELPDLAGMSAWLAAAGQRSLHTLPLIERAPGERSPYSALTAFGIDPIHIGLDAVEDFVAAGGRRALGPDAEGEITRLRADPTIDYDGVRSLKHRALQMAFESFERHEVAGRSRRAEAFDRFCAEEAAWLADFALYRALRATQPAWAWKQWPPALREHDADACRAARLALAPVLRSLAYGQWVAHQQLAAARRTANECGVALVGDLPFTVAVDSADVWGRRGDFDPDTSIGAPPDAFNADGQDWALPAFRWDAVRTSGFAWLRARIEYTGRWLDGVRVDHVVGYFRTFVRPVDGKPHFVPGTEPEQRALGSASLDVLQAAGRGRLLIVEDLGDIPPFVRETLAERRLPGFRVLRWESDGPAFRDPCAYPAASVASSGTHDTSSLATWWSEELDDEARRRLVEVPVFAGLRTATSAYTPAVHQALLEGLYASGSDVALLVVPDVFGGRERINTPATIGPENWGYRIPCTVEALAGGAGLERAAWLRRLAARHRRA